MNQFQCPLCRATGTPAMFAHATGCTATATLVPLAPVDYMEAGGAIEDVLAERGNRYGKFEDHARVTQSLKDVLYGRVAERKLVLANDEREALDMIAHKLGRIVNGDPHYADSWIDIAGYAKLVADRLEGKAA